jgi:hypothetical protein
MPGRGGSKTLTPEVHEPSTRLGFRAQRAERQDQQETEGEHFLAHARISFLGNSLIANHVAGK